MKEFTGVKEKLKVFGFGQLQNLVTLFSILRREEISIEDVEEYVLHVKMAEKAYTEEFTKRAKETERIWNKNTRRCPDCTKPLMLRAIKIPRGKENVKGYTCHWFCQGEDCTFEEYAYEDFQELYKKIMGGR